MSNTKKQYRIKSRFRFTIFVLLIILTIVTSTNTALGLYDAASLTIDEYITVEICSGDTLWNIAQVYMPSMNTRSAVHKICKLNDITADSLYVGKSIQIPIYN